jgi:hypothetical protein
VTLSESEFIDHIKVLPASDQLKKLRHITLLIESGESSFAAEFVGQAIDAKLRALYEIRSPAFVGYASKLGLTQTHHIFHIMKKYECSKS